MRRRIVQSLTLFAGLALIAGLAVAQDYTVANTGCSAFSSISGDPSTVRLATVSGCDDCTELVTLPFTFMWFGDTSITQIRVSSNGQINVNSADTDSNCCSADPLVTLGAYLNPRIAIAQDDLQPNYRGNFYALNTGSSWILEINDVPFYYGDGYVNAQAELFPDGTIELRWGSISGSSETMAAGVEDDTRSSATPASPPNFDSGGIARDADFGPLNGQCRLFTPPGGSTGDCDLRPVISRLDVLEPKVDTFSSDTDAALSDIKSEVTAIQTSLNTAVTSIGGELDDIDTTLADMKSELVDIAALIDPCVTVRLLTAPVLAGAPELTSLHPCYVAPPPAP